MQAQHLHRCTNDFFCSHLAQKLIAFEVPAEVDRSSPASRGTKRILIARGRCAQGFRLQGGGGVTQLPDKGKCAALIEPIHRIVVMRMYQLPSKKSLKNGVLVTCQFSL